MIMSMNTLPELKLPQDGGVQAGEKIEWVDYVISTGDIANRMEHNDLFNPLTATQCWEIFEQQYTQDLRLSNRDGVQATLLVVPGNHDITNAVGFHRAMTPEYDNGAALAIYNRSGQAPVSEQDYDAVHDKTLINLDTGANVTLLLVQMWPDSVARDWLDQQIARLAPNTSVLLFTHDQPDVEAKHLINPNEDHRINADHKFENLLSDVSSVLSVQDIPIKEHRELASFFRTHSQIIAYFHGNENYNEFYDWRGPDSDIFMPIFRVDSPMKGDISGKKDEHQLSFQFITIDTDAKLMTVREALWNTDFSEPTKIVWGDSRTLALR